MHSYTRIYTQLEQISIFAREFNDYISLSFHIISLSFHPFALYIAVSQSISVNWVRHHVTTRLIDGSRIPVFYNHTSALFDQQYKLSAEID